MFGRTTSGDAPACNAEGIAYRDLWLRERAIHADLDRRLRSALELWLRAIETDDAKQRKKLVKQVWSLTRFLLS